MSVQNTHTNCEILIQKISVRMPVLNTTLLPGLVCDKRSV